MHLKIKILILVIYTAFVSYVVSAIIENMRVRADAKAVKASQKVTASTAKTVNAVDSKAQEQEVRIRTVYKTIYVKAKNHESSGIDSNKLSNGWVRIYNEGAKGVPNNTSSIPLDDGAPSTISGADALTTIIAGQAQYHEISNRLIHCQSYVKSLEPFYSD